MLWSYLAVSFKIKKIILGLVHNTFFIHWKMIPFERTHLHRCYFLSKKELQQARSFGIKGPFSLSVSLSGLLLPSFFLASKRFGKGKVTHARHLYCLCRIKCFFVLWLLTCKCHKEEKPWPLPVRYYDGQFIPMINLQTTSVSTLLSELVMFCFSEFSIQAQYSSERHHSSETRSTRQNPILL